MDYSGATFTLSTLSAQGIAFYNQFGWPIVQIIGGIAIGATIVSVVVGVLKKAMS